MSRTASLCPAGIVTATRTFSRLTSVPVASSMRAMTTSSSAWSRMVSSTACSIWLPLQGMSGHQLVGMNPSRERADALEPSADARIVGPRYAEFFRPVQVAAHREVGDARRVSHREVALREMPVQDAERSLDAAAQELVHLRLADLGERDHPAQGRDVARQLVIVPEDPAQHFELVFSLELAEVIGEVVQDHPRLAQALAAVFKHRRFGHLVDVRAVLGLPRLAVEEVDEARLPFGAAELQRQRDLKAVARLGEAVETKFRRQALALQRAARLRVLGGDEVHEPRREAIIGLEAELLQ